MSKTSKTAALREAQAAVGRPIGSHTSWVVYLPYDFADLRGPSTEMRADSYTKIVQKRACRVAECALYLMGVEDAGEKVEMVAYRNGPMSAPAMVEAVLAM